MANVLLTGATGFIGKHLLAALTREGHEVMALIRPGQSDADSRLKAVLNDMGIDGAFVSALSGDLAKVGLGLSTSDWELALEADVIIHSGASMDLKMEAAEAAAGILDGVDHLLELAAAAHRTRGLSQFIHLVGYMSPVDDDNAFTLDPYGMDFLPDASPYERSKAVADVRVRRAARQEGYPLTVINPSTVVGPHDTGVTEQLAGLGLLVDAIRRGLMPVIPGGEKYWLPLVNVDDLATFMVRIIAWPEAFGKTYVMLDPASPHPPELLKIAARELAMSPPKLVLPLSVVKASLRFGGTALTGIPAASLDYLTNRSFSLATTTAAREALGLGDPSVRESLPFVIADLDYRLGGRGRLPAGMHTARLGDLAALAQPRGSGAPWVIVHGLYSSAEAMAELAQHLQGAPVWLLDLPGFGRSPLTNGGSPLDRAVAAVVHAIEEIDRPVRLVGHSFGAAVVAEVARRLPSTVKSLHLLQPPLRRPDLPWTMRAQRRWPFVVNGLLRFGQPRWLLEREAIKTGGFDSIAEIPPWYIDTVRADMSSPRIRRSTLDVLRWLVSSDMTMNLHVEGVPVQLLWGEHDPSYPVAWGEEAVRRHENVRLRRVPHGHQFPLSHPEETARILCKDV